MQDRSVEQHTEPDYWTEGAAAERWTRARFFFEAKEYANAARILEGLRAQEPENDGVRLLLARSYYHSAQLRRAERELREIVERDPVARYARLMLGRTLERQGRDAEAAPYLRMAAVLGGDFPE
ncbi:M48 family metallopeptidase [Streptomyces sp. NA04227]|uniref:tetratricopeptide repeat protein n=1 Tax=Streptomyces sp. NA04227 TaxID=2742136 RepID=UPI0020CA3F9F|nr:tetratricopeptide repeat protein [Streptomyces sp. NA04227]